MPVAMCGIEPQPKSYCYHQKLKSRLQGVEGSGLAALDTKPKFPKGYPGLSSRAGTFPPLSSPTPESEQMALFPPLLEALPTSSPGPRQLI